MPLRLSILLLCLFAACSAVAQSSGARGLNGLSEIPFAQLTDRNITSLGKAALAIRASDWKHGESDHFVYHFFQGFVATAVAVEAEFYYRFVSTDLQRDTSQWERKCHVFIFEKPDDWKEFQSRARLDPWTGGIHANGELFIVRDPSYKWKGHTLGHEIAHLVIDRFFGSGVPLWLNEGYAEYAGSRGYASFHRARGYSAKPKSDAVAPADYIPLNQLTAMLSYPADVSQVETFYNQSQRLVRFLWAENRVQFAQLFASLAGGRHFETALAASYGTRFLTAAALDREFREYAARDAR